MSFDAYAKQWDTDDRMDRAKIIAKAMSKAISMTTDGSAMEFGCGTGLISFNLLDRFKTIDLYDTSQGMIEVLKQKIDHYGVTTMKPYQVDITEAVISKTSYDVIYNSLVLHHIIDIKEVLHQFYELLNEGGELCIVDLDEDDGRFHRKYPDFDGHNGFKQKYLAALLEEAGFNEVKTSTFYYGEKRIDGEEIKYSLFMLIGIKD